MNTEINFFYAQSNEHCSEEGIQNLQASDDATQMEIPIFDIRTTSVQCAHHVSFERLEQEVREEPKGIFTFHRRTPSDELSVDVLKETFDDWKIVTRRKRQRVGRGGVLLHSAREDIELNSELPIEPVQTHTTSSKRNNVKERRGTITWRHVATRKGGERIVTNGARECIRVADRTSE
jgi:hypothetical protein